jgi:hypothetical protein
MAIDTNTMASNITTVTPRNDIGAIWESMNHYLNHINELYTTIKGYPQLIHNPQRRVKHTSFQKIVVRGVGFEPT